MDAYAGDDKVTEFPPATSGHPQPRPIREAAGSASTSASRRRRLFSFRWLYHRPGSFLRLIWIGFLCVSIPLLAALLHAGYSIGRLARESGEAIQLAASAASQSRLLVDQVTSLERKARQLQALAEEQILTDYEERREAVRETLGTLEHLMGGQEALLDRLGRIAEVEVQIHGVLVQGPQAEGAQALALDRFAEINQLAREVSGESNRLAFEGAERTRATADAIQRRLVWEGMALVPITVILAAFFAQLLSRPVRQIDRAIHRLGKADFASPIAVRGPRDLEFLGERLDWLRRRLSDLEAQKARFLADVSHELKTPLTAIREGAEILTEEVTGRLGEGQQEVVGIIRQNSVRLQKLIENFLNFNMADARGRARGDERVALDVLTERVLADHKPLIVAKNIALEAQIAPVAVRGSRQALRTILDNLVSNAVKFTPQRGRVAVCVRGEGDQASIRVRDSGPGVPPVERPRVFEAFYQGSARSHGPLRGTGLGLAIVAEHVRSIGGTVEVADAPEGGAEFQVRLPVGDVEWDRDRPV